MTPHGLLFVFVLWILQPAAAVAAGVLAWWAFRRKGPSGALLAVALGMLVMPYVLIALIEPEDGLSVAFSPNSPFVISLLVGAVIVVAVVRRTWRDS